MGEIDGLLARSAAHAADFEGGDLPAAPARRIAVVACMDARLDPASLLGLAPGDAHVIRNAGGVVSEDVVRSLAISQVLLGTREVMLIQHTDCGMLAGEQAIAAAIEERTGHRPPFAMGGFGDLEAHLRASLARLRESPYLAHMEALRGFVYEVETGRLRELGSAGESG